MGQLKFFRAGFDIEDVQVFNNTKYYAILYGHMTIVSQYDEESHIMSYGVSFCSPFDKYDRVYGDKLAIDRMREGCVYGGEVHVSPKKLTHHYSLFKILCDMIGRSIIPSWAEDDVRILLHDMV